jgi:hypothetical protein
MKRGMNVSFPADRCLSPNQRIGGVPEASTRLNRPADSRQYLGRGQHYRIARMASAARNLGFQAPNALSGSAMMIFASSLSRHGRAKSR